MRKFLPLLLLVLSCTTNTPPESRVLRIVSMAPSVTEILFAIGAGGSVVGVTIHCDHPDAVKKIGRIGAYADPDMERILALKPTLVIGTSIAPHRRVLEALAKRGVRTLCVPEGGISDLQAAIKRIGEATHHTHQAERLLSSLNQAIETARLAARGKKRVRVLFLVGHDPLIAAARNTLAADLLEIAGATPLPEEANGYISVSLERIAAEKPDIILDASMGSETGKNEVVLNQLARVIPDIEKRYATVDPNLFCRSGPRVVLALKQLLEVLERWR